jgi:hypothetical protein
MIDGGLLCAVMLPQQPCAALVRACAATMTTAIAIWSAAEAIDD